MFQDDVLYSLGMFAVAAWLFKMWLSDTRNFVCTGTPAKGEFPGARPVSIKLAVFGAMCGVVLLAAITAAEIAGGGVEEQTKVSFMAIFSWTAAAFIEELIFRGYLIVQNKGKLLLWGSAILFSLIFALCHPFFWDFSIPENGGLAEASFTINLTEKAARDTIFVFLSSMVFYALRFCPQNKMRSLILLSPPGEGKTTLLRDLSRLVCGRKKLNVLVSDERGELSAGDLGETADVIRYADKLTAFTAGIRAMRPDLIITDELLPEDYAAVRRAMQGGIFVFASAHLTREEDVPEKLFSRYIVLDGLGRIGTISGADTDAVA